MNNNVPNRASGQTRDKLGTKKQKKKKQSISRNSSLWPTKTKTNHWTESSAHNCCVDGKFKQICRSYH